jgi:hypothetical protein
VAAGKGVSVTNHSGEYAMTDLIEDLAVLRESSDLLLQQLTGAQERVRPAEAADDTGQITVRLGADGRLESVKVGFTWDQHLTAAELPAAVVGAVTQARVQQVEQYGEAIREMEDEPAPRARPARTDTPLLDALRERTEGHADSTAAAAELVEELLLDARAGLEEAMLAAAQRARREGLSAALRATRLADIARLAVGATTTPEGDDR